MMNYDVQQAVRGPQSTASNNNSTRVSPHLYHQQQHNHPQQLLHLFQQHHHHHPKNEPYSPTVSLSTASSRSSTIDTNCNSETPVSAQQHQSASSKQRSFDYSNSSLCSEPSLKHARFDHTVWPNTT